MCTVTYLPINKDEFILTSSRDVPFLRERALDPKKYFEEGIELFYPKDGRAGGTWIGSSSKKRLICLLNGGFKNHISKDFYRISRGKIVISLLKVGEIYSKLSEIDLKEIEPFTLVIVDWNEKLRLIEFVWDGKNKHLKDLPQEPHIWSSSTLYNKEMKDEREGWFLNWLQNNSTDSNSILRFHHEAGVGDPTIDVIMKRPNVGTVSITSVHKDKSGVQMNYESV